MNEDKEPVKLTPIISEPAISQDETHFEITSSKIP